MLKSFLGDFLNRLSLRINLRFLSKNKRICFLLMIVVQFLIGIQVSIAQMYRPPVNWFELETPHFRIIFHEGFDSVAQASARILEHNYKPVQKLTGGKLKRFPVVLNGYNDLSNGYVTPINFRMEVEIPPLKGKILNPKVGGWLENVLPHELVHAEHFSVVPKLGFSALIYPFWPDGARSLHFMAPIGFHEGLAVHYESDLGLNTDLNGRGNHPFFTNEINSVFTGSNPWSFGQMMHSSDETRPFNRHYQGGFEFIDWVQKNKGELAANEVIDFMGRIPFLSYGGAYLFTQWEWPGTAFKQYEADKLGKERRRQETIRMQVFKKETTLSNQNDTIEPAPILIGKVLPSSFKGESSRRPIYLNENELISYRSFYDQKAGFYLHDIKTGKAERLQKSNIVEDYRIDISPNREKIVFARYDVNTKYDAMYTSGLYELEVKTNKVTEIATGNRLFNPVYTKGGWFAFQTNKETNRLVFVDEKDKSIREILNPGVQNLIDLDYSFENGKTALIANIHGDIALYIADSESELANIFEAKPVFFQSGISLYDVVWHPNGTKLLFTADVNKVMNVFEYDLETKEIVQLINSLFNAYEASYNSDGSEIAFVVQYENEQKLSVMKRANFLNKVPSKLKNENQKELRKERIWSDVPDSIWKKSPVKPYKSGLDWVLPRAMVPTFQQNAVSNKYGLSLLGTDVLQRHTWSGDLAIQYDELWYDLSYQYTGFWPGFEIRTFREAIEINSSAASSPVVIMAEKGVSIGIPLRINLEQNISTSSLFVNPRLVYSNYSYVSNSLNALGFESLDDLVDGNVFSLQIQAQFNWKLLQRIRDFQPSEGLILFAQSEIDLTRNTFYNIYQDSAFPDGVRRRFGVLGGVFGFLPNPLFRNHSLRLGYRTMYQPHIQVYSTSNFVWNSDAQAKFRNSEWLQELSSRYTFPLFYPENGGVLIPWYVQNLYGVLFSRSHFGSNNPYRIEPNNHIFGAGFRMTTGVSNIRIDIGVSWFYTVGNSGMNRWIGDF